MDDVASDVLSQGVEEEKKEILEGKEPVASSGEELSQDEKSSPPDLGAEGLPKYAKERIGKLQNRYTRDVRRLKGEIGDLRSQLYSMQQSQTPAQASPDFQSNPQMMQPGGYQPPVSNSPPGVQEYVQQAVAAALRAQEEQKARAAQEAEAIHIQNQYRGLQDHLDNAGSQYEDFEDVVRGESVPFTGAMRDAALLMPMEGPGAAAHVLYKLAKNKDELQRISRLPTIDQARELLKLSRALEMGEGGKEQKSSAAAYSLGQLKNNPSYRSSSAINENTPLSELKKLARAGWKSNR